MMKSREATADISETVDERERPAPFGAPHVFVLVMVAGDDATAVHRIIRQDTVLGRGVEAHLVIEDDLVSKVHCRIRVDGSVCTIVDPGSRNGTSVNGRRLSKDVAQRLRNLDEIEIGGHRLMLLTGRFRGTPKDCPQ
ncbi:MAG TPA: FHA domain-containing protein [Candidatus Cryosericum sp.]|nr:FHA domain-containing protein [Candidatus Cryosericum sp.]